VNFSFLSSQGGAFVSQSNLDLSNLISFFFLGIFFYISSGSNGLAGGFWCVCGIAQLGEIFSKGAILFFSLLAFSRDIYETFT